MFFLYELLMIFWSSRKGLHRIVYNAVAYESSFPTSPNYDHFFEFLRWSRNWELQLCVPLRTFANFPVWPFLLFSKFNALKTPKWLTQTLFIVLKCRTYLQILHVPLSLLSCPADVKASNFSLMAVISPLISSNFSLSGDTNISKTSVSWKILSIEIGNGRRGCLMVSVNSGSTVPGSSPEGSHCVAFNVPHST